MAVVVVSWNSSAFAGGCARSLRGLRRLPAEVVLVDNASADGTPEVFRRELPEAEVLLLPANEGFCRANNLGIAGTRSPFVLLLNPDARLDAGFVEELLPAFDDPSVGIATGKLRREDGRTIDSAGQSLGLSRKPVDRGYGTPDRGQFDRDGETFGACAAAALYRRSMLEDVAGPGGEVFDERFFAFYEDLDLAWRARRRGWTCAYRYRATGVHVRGGSASSASVRGRFRAILGRPPEIRYHVVKNRWLTLLRNESARDFVAHLPFIAARDLATLALVAATSPGVLGRLWREREIFAAAARRRRLDSERGRSEISRRGGGEA